MSLAHEIATALGNGKEEGRGGKWVTLCPVHGDRNPSLSISDNDEGSVTVHCHVGCDWKEIKDRLKDMGLLKNGKKYSGNQSDKQRISEQDAEGYSGGQTREKKSFVWDSAEKDPEYVLKYLAGRGIVVNALPACMRWGKYKDKSSGELQQMIVCAASKPSDNAVYAVQRLFIDTEENRKTGAKMLGECDGRGVWLDRKGATHELLIGEGVETTFSGMQAIGINGVATLSTSGMKDIELPHTTVVIHILVDSDPVRDKEAASMPGQKAAYELAQRFIDGRDDRKAFLVSPDDSCFSDLPEKLDFNDLLKADLSGDSIRERFAKKVEVRDLEWKPKSDAGNDGDGDDDGDGYYPERTLKELENINSSHAGVLLSGKFRVLKECFDTVSKRYEVSFVDVASFNNYYCNRKYKVGTGEDAKYLPISKIWMDWPERRTFDSVVFSPGNNVSKTAYNLWRGWSITPKQGDWSLMREHIKTIICDGDENLNQYLLAWMARIVQFPGGRRPGVAVVLTGGKGIGKGVFVNYFGKMFGGAFMPISSSDGFTGSFNMHLAKSLLVFLDEAVWGGDKQHEGRLKAMITEETMLFQPKGIDSMALENHMNIIMASNENWVVPAGVDERRFFVLKVNGRKAKDYGYFRSISDQMDNGGCEAMMYDLLRHDFSGVELRQAPVTTGLTEQVSETLDDVLSFWRHVLGRGFLLSDISTGGPVKSMEGTEDGLWPNKAYKYEIYNEFYTVYGKGKRHMASEDSFWRRTYTWAGDSMIQRRSSAYGVIKPRHIEFDQIGKMRALFTKHTGIEFTGEEESWQTTMWDDQF